MPYLDGYSNMSEARKEYHPYALHLPIQERHDFIWVVGAGFMLTLVSGLLNSVNFLQFANSITHTTGNMTKITLELVIYENFSSAAKLALFIFLFMVGSSVTAFIVGSTKFKLGRRYGFVLMLEGALILLAALLVQFYENALLDAAHQSLISAASGMQNAMTASFSGAVLRTTHLTGLATDIGTTIGFWLKYRRRKPQKVELWRLKVFIPLICGFFVGGIIGCLLYKYIGVHCLYIPAGILFIIGGVYFAERNRRGWVKRRREGRFRELQDSYTTEELLGMSK